MKPILVLFILISTSSILFGQEEKCKCFNGIGSSESDKPSLIVPFKNGINLSVCGYELEKISQNEIRISEFNVFNCKTGKSLVEYSALQTCNVTLNSGRLLITELKNLPAGVNWKWTLIPISQKQISEQGNNVIISSEKCVYEKIKIPQSKIDQFMEEVEQLKGKGYNKMHEMIMGRLTLLALNGNSKARSILTNFDTYFKCTPDGALAEQWSDAIGIVSWIKK
jgi:hypothetical protein